MDGLLLDSERISLQVWQEVCLPVAPFLEESVFIGMIGHKWEDCVQLLRQAMPGQEDQAGELARAAQARYHQRVACQPIPVKTGVEAILRHLREARIPCAVATSTLLQLALTKLRNAGLAEYFSAVAGGEEVERGKPAPDLYLLAARRLGVDPNRCIAFEDSGPGIRSAHAAGMLPILIPDIKLPEAVIAEGLTFAVFESIDQAIPHF